MGGLILEEPLLLYNKEALGVKHLLKDEAWTILFPIVTNAYSLFIVALPY